tara:strand:+ start:59 stop:187 length:129 start_codon:yes stop_codon:yes gene_type:complete
MHISTWIEMEIERIKLEDSEEEFQCTGTLIKEHGIGDTEVNK